MPLNATTFKLCFIGCLFLEQTASAEHCGNFTYAASTGNTEITITGYAGSEKAVVIPATIEGKPVVCIGESAFAEQDSISEITIPGSVTRIEDKAFSHCTKLTSAFFIGNAPPLGTDVFNDCAETFTVFYTPEGIGFTSPTWLGYPSEMIDPFFMAFRVLEADGQRQYTVDESSDRMQNQKTSDRPIILLFLLHQSRLHK